MRPALAGVALVLGLSLGGCGGGAAGEADSESAPSESRNGVGAVLLADVQKPNSRAKAARFLTQATFGPTQADVDRVMAIGYEAWIDEQLAMPARSHRAYWEAADAAIKARTPKGGARQVEVLESFWKQALSGEDQLRQRMVFALSQIFVVSMVDSKVGHDPRAVAAWLDMLGDKGLGNYRELLEAVTTHPMMGQYLSHLRSQRADPKTGRVPDENYAREVMQLFSIGLVELNPNGVVRVANGRPIETYGAADVAGLAKVFTGWSWACPAWPDKGCFYSGSADSGGDDNRGFKRMRNYPQFHSTEEKSFLGITIPARSNPDPNADLKAALDRLAAHPNVAPFIGKQLIQRLVTSNPSTQYVAAVSAAFNASGGDMKATLKAVLLHPEARWMTDTSGKLREPVLKLSAFLRAFGFRSDSGKFRVNNTDNPGTSLGQTPMRSPSVFNFYRPGYVAPGTESAAANMTAPEMQIVSEATAAGYVNFMRDNIAYGAGGWNAAFERRDLQGDFSAELARAQQPKALVELMSTKLMYGQMPAALKAEIVAAVESIAIPELNKKGTNQREIDKARRARVDTAIFLSVISPEFQVQK